MTLMSTFRFVTCAALIGAGIGLVNVLPHLIRHDDPDKPGCQPETMQIIHRSDAVLPLSNGDTLFFRGNGVIERRSLQHPADSARVCGK